MKNNTWQLLNKAALETLEDRRMMSATPLAAVTLANGTLTLDGKANNATRMTVDYANNGADHTRLYVKFGSGANAVSKFFPSSSVKQLDIIGGTQTNYIYIDPVVAIPSVVHGEASTVDEVIRGGGGNNTIYGGNGNDLLHAEGKNNVLYAGPGRDTLVGDKSNDSLYAGSGADSLDGGLGSGQIIGVKPTDTVVNAGNQTISLATQQDSSGGGSGTTGTGSTGTGSTGTGGSGNGTTVGSGNGTGTSGTGTGTTGTGTGTTGTGTGTTGTGTTGTGTTGTGTGTLGIGTGGNTNAIAPSPVINLLDGVREVGLGVNVDALASTLGAGTSITAKYEWDFGDTGTRFNNLTGFNGSHVYDTPGNYTITLTVVDEDGGTASVSQQITIAASTRNQIFVDSVNGSDTNSGTQDFPLKSLPVAFAKIGDNTEVLLKAGDTFAINQSLQIKSANVLVGRYGEGANPLIMHTKGNGLSTINVYHGSASVTVQDITIDTPYGVAAGQKAPKVGVSGVYVAGTNIVVRRCTFLNIDDAINENGNPTGVTLQDNDAPSVTGVRGYFVWGQGSQTAIIGNTVADSTVEHNLRLVGMNEVLVEGNNLTNTDGKGCIEMHVGKFAYIADNIVHDGDIRVGPLGLWGEAPTDSTDDCVIVDNQLTDTFIYVQAGTHHAFIAGNVILQSKGTAITINGPDAQGPSADITLSNNTAVSTATSGSFIRVYGHVNGIVMTNNLWVAPSIVPGAYGTSAVSVSEADLSSFTTIANNIWPDPVKIFSYAKGGINIVGSTGNGYVTPQAWDSFSQVQNDQFENVTLADTYSISLNGLTIGAPMALAA